MRKTLLVTLVFSMFFASGLQASPFTTPPTTTPPFEDLPPRPDVPPADRPPFDLGFEIPVGPPAGVVTGPGFEVPVTRPVGLWMMTIPSSALGLDLDTPLGPPPNLPPIFDSPADLDHPPFSEFPPDFEPPPFFDFLPPGFSVRPVFPSSNGVFTSVSNGVVPEPTTGLLLSIGLIGLAGIRSYRRKISA